MKIKDQMTTDAVTVAPETPLRDVAALLVERRSSGVPVVDAGGTVLGVAETAEEAMTLPAVTVGANRPVAAAARLMLEHGVNRLPVEGDGLVVGIVTRADLVRAFARPDAEIEEELRKQVLGKALWSDTAAVELRVQDGHVHLAGEVDRRSEARIVVRLAERVPGVVAVHSELAWRTDNLARRWEPVA